MIDQSKAKIFLAEERGFQENHSYRTYQTFNFGSLFNEHKSAFGDLQAWNDDCLAGGCSFTMTMTESVYLLLLPVVGAIHYKDSFGNVSLLTVGEIQVITLPASSSFDLSNPYDDEPVNYLQFLIRTVP